MSDDARLSKMLFEARELISMFNDMVERRAGREDTWSRRVRDQIDAYRAERGWSPHGFGDEEDVPVLNVHAPNMEAEALRYARAVEEWNKRMGADLKPERMPPGDDPRSGEEIPHV